MNVTSARGRALAATARLIVTGARAGALAAAACSGDCAARERARAKAATVVACMADVIGAKTGSSKAAACVARRSSAAAPGERCARNGLLCTKTLPLIKAPVWPASGDMSARKAGRSSWAPGAAPSAVGAATARKPVGRCARSGFLTNVKLEVTRGTSAAVDTASAAAAAAGASAADAAGAEAATSKPLGKGAQPLLGAGAEIATALDSCHRLMAVS